MTSTFPFVDPAKRIEHALWRLSASSCINGLVGAVHHTWQLLQLHPLLRPSVMRTHLRLLRVIVQRLLVALASPKLQSHRSIDRILNASQHCIEHAQTHFSDFTSGWRLCQALLAIVASNLTPSEFVDTFVDFAALDASHAALLSCRKTANAVAQPLDGRWRSYLANEAPPNYTMKLLTLEEHRFATRFQPKRVTQQTWRTARHDAFALLATIDRSSLVEALYLLLELLSLRPDKCDLAPLFLNIGAVYLTFDNLEDAVRAFRNVLRLDSTHWKAHVNLGVTLARARDLSGAKRHLDAALQALLLLQSESNERYTSVISDVRLMLEEIDAATTVRATAMLDAAHDARAFTHKFLLTVHAVAATRCSNSNTAPLDYTLSHNSRSTVLVSPLLLDGAAANSGWQGALASLLHRLFTCASVQSISVAAALAQIDTKQSGSVTIDQLARVVYKVTGTPLSEAEQTALTLVCPNNTIRTSVVVPNTETLAAIIAIERDGVSHATLHWTLWQQHTRRSKHARADGLWYWLDLTMAAWVCALYWDVHTSAAVVLVSALRVLGWWTPLDFVLKPNRIDLTTATRLPLSIPARHMLASAVDCARSTIRHEAAVVLQMFCRRIICASRQTHHQRVEPFVRAVGTTPTSPIASPSCAESVLAHQLTLQHATAAEQAIIQCVLECIDSLVDCVVASIRLERRVIDDRIDLHATIPVRTEKRLASMQASVLP